jgi:murein DD-endopeptidase MepM/ murein hydrolase activator NlpD
VVKARGFQGSAGNYLVIDGAGVKQDYFYAHLRAPAKVAKGQSITTGQIIGKVGDTGNAQGCHLHFEIWVGKGWYSGGAPIDPLPALRYWDSFS